MSRVPYASVVGSLMYAMMCTRPDICYTVRLVSRYQSNPSQKHWMIVKRILRYLKGTSNYMLCYKGKKDLRLIGFSYADWGGDVNQSKSTSGCAFLLNDSAILWRSKKQSCIAFRIGCLFCSNTRCCLVKKFPVSFENCQISLRPSDNLL